LKKGDEAVALAEKRSPVAGEIEPRLEGGGFDGGEEGTH